MFAAAAAAKSLQWCPTLSDPMDCSPPGSSIHGIFQARVLEWGAIAFSKYLCLSSAKSLKQSKSAILLTYIHIFSRGPNNIDNRENTNCSRDFKEIKMIKKYSENFNDNIFDELDSMDKFIERHKLLIVQLTQE